MLLTCHSYRLDLVMTDASDIVDVAIGSQSETSDDCFVRCELPVEQVVPEQNVRRVLLFKY